MGKFDDMNRSNGDSVFSEEIDAFLLERDFRISGSEFEKWYRNKKGFYETNVLVTIKVDKVHFYEETDDEAFLSQWSEPIKPEQFESLDVFQEYLNQLFERHF